MALPSWFLGVYPDKRVILTSYEADFAAKWGRKCRDVLTRHGSKVFGVRVSSDSKAANRWDIRNRAGGMETAGMGGAILGKGADLFIIDDPIKNAEEALSPTIRQKHWDWYITTAETRLEPKASTVVIMQRWHTEDLVGRLIESCKEIGQKFVDCRMPAIAEADDMLGREEGAALWPERYPISTLRLREARQKLWFPAQYQGRPVPLGGVLFQEAWFKSFDWITENGPRFEGLIVGETGTRYMHGRVNRYMVVDPSLGQKNSDRVAIGIFGIPDDGQRVFVLWMVSQRIPLEQIVPRLDRLAREWRVEACLMEANGFQVQLANSARSVLPCPVREIDPEGKSKLSRGIPAVELCAAGDLLVPESAPWLTEYKSELCNWTGNDGDRDDQVDVTAYAVRELLTRRYVDDGPILCGPVKGGRR